MMRYSTIDGLDKPISRLVQGTLMVTQADGKPGFDLFDDIYALGCTTFDTAHVYQNGQNERLFGQWLRSRNLRDQVVIIGKGAHHNADRQRVTPFDISADLHDSLARLQVDSIDLYLLHRDDPRVPVEPIIDVLNEHQQAGRITLFGASNWSHERIRAANTYAASNGLHGFSFSSPNLSLAVQREAPWDNCISISGDSEAQTWYQAHHLPVFSWSSLAGGFFSERFTPDNLASFDNYFDLLVVKCYCTPENFTRLERTRQFAAHSGYSVPQIALAYVLSQPLNIFALVGCNTSAEFTANRAALDLTLAPEVLAWLDLRSDAVPF